MQAPVRRPLVGVALFLIAGILLGEYCPVPSDWLWGAAAALALCAVLSLARVRSPWSVSVCLFALVVAAGILLQRHTAQPPAPNDIRFAAGDRSAVAKLKGIIATPPEIEPLDPVLPNFGKETDANSRTTFDLDATALRLGRQWRKATGRVRVNIYDEAGDLRYGDEIEFSASIKRPPAATNPGQFDYARFLGRRGIFVLANAGSRDNVRILTRNNGTWIKTRLFAVRRAAQAVIERHAGAQTRSILACMLLGHRRAVHGPLADAFIRTGTAHVLAISGLHLMILAGTLWWLLCLTPLNRRLSAVLVLLFVGFFVVITGMRASVQRAGTIAAMMCLGEIVSKRSDTLNSLGAAAVLVLLGNPNEIFSAGFQLTFSAVLGIVCFARPLDSFLFGGPSFLDRLAVEEKHNPAAEWIGRYGRGANAVSCAAMLATAPLVAWHFHIFSPVAILLNLLIFPFLWIIISLGTLEVLAGTLCAPLAWPLAQCVNGATYLFAHMVLIAARLGFGYLYLPGPSGLWLIGYYGVLAVAACPSLVPLRRVHIWALMAALFLFPAASRAVSSPPRELRVTCLDVGHGAAFFVEFPNGRNLLYDAGTARKYDIGGSVVAPFLWSRGVRRIDALVLSHAHADHYSGVPSLCERFPIGTVLIHRAFLDRPTPQWVIDYVARRGTKVEIIAAGDRIAGYGECRVEVLHPPDGPVLDKLRPNDGSCVLRIGWGDFRLLLTGDLETQGVRMVGCNFPGLHPDAMQLPHHGRLSAATRDMVLGFSPRVAMVNADDQDASPAVEQIARRGVAVYATSEAGAIALRVGAAGDVHAETFRPCGTP
ncbi:MAG: ComEC/Rec2 family competence protein [Planctomycetes bacterium]|nr:ComEC/Rec2 family competence protein [Planctomycetota bacterium]